MAQCHPIGEKLRPLHWYLNHEGTKSTKLFND
jgi:hypothetical protein